jgi:sec-independent protein translocase protein TatB
MFGLGTAELLFILVLVLLVYGPDRIPEMAKKLGKLTLDLRKMGETVRRTVEQEMNKDEDAKPSEPDQRLL